MRNNFTHLREMLQANAKRKPIDSHVVKQKPYAIGTRTTYIIERLNTPRVDTYAVGFIHNIDQE